MLKRLLISGSLLAVVAIAAEVEAQVVAQADLNKAKLTWEWTQGVAPLDGQVAEFTVKCGQTTGVYTKLTKIVTATVRDANVRDVVGGSGNWFCTVSASNSFGESGNSNEVPFVAGAAPSKPFSTQVRPQ
jgi:hypothetical protein